MTARQGSATAKPGSGDFERDVHAVARLIPPGRVTSYGAIARYLGAARSSRMVGWAMNRALEVDPNGATDLRPVPAHRVVNRLDLVFGTLYNRRAGQKAPTIQHYHSMVAEIASN